MRLSAASLILASACGRIHFEPVTGDGEVPGADAMVLDIPPHPITTTAHASCPSIAWTGNEVAVAWQDTRITTTDPKLYFTRVTLDGTITVAERMFGTLATFVGCPILIWTGTEFGVTWSMNLSEDIYMAVLDPAGAVVQQTTVANLGPNEFGETIAWDGNVFGISYAFTNGGNQSIRFAPVSGSGALLAAGIDVAVGAGTASIAALPASGFALLSKQPASVIQYDELDDNGLRVSTVQAGSDVVLSRLAFAHSGTHYAFAYEDGTKRLATAVGNRGSAATRLSLGTAQLLYMALAVTPTGFAVAWVEADQRLLFAHLDTAGALASPVYQLATGVPASNVNRFELASTSGGFAVVYSDSAYQLVLLAFSI